MAAPIGGFSKQYLVKSKYMSTRSRSILLKRHTIPTKINLKQLSGYRFRSHNPRKIVINGRFIQGLTSKFYFSSETSGPTSANTNAAINIIPQERSSQYGFAGINRIMMMYEDFVGLTEVKQAQEKVVNAEQKFLQVQEDRRNMQQELLTVQAEVRKVAAELEKTSRTDSRYIDLVKKEHEILLIEKEMTNKIKILDKAERDFFSLLSAALRESHEKERSRAEKTKYWSIIGSVIGAIIGIAGSTFNNFKRMKELRAIVTENVESTSEYKKVADDLIKTLALQQAQIEHAIPEGDITEPVNPFYINQQLLNGHSEAIIAHFNRQTNTLISQLKDIEKVLSLNQATSNNSNIVYVGPEVESMFLKTEHRLETLYKKNVYMTTAAIAIGIFILSIFMRGS
ncbi:coiled-coil domain-containing protein 51 [Biomphalaria glabrata]|nr:coiled-coil domain-containing protein 51 [Biomphalaria glabrata]